MITTHPNHAMAQLFEAAPSNDLPQPPNDNSVLPMRWRFIPHWYKKANGGPLLINARAETIADKPAVRAAVRDQRCLTLAKGFYERTNGGALIEPLAV